MIELTAEQVGVLESNGQPLEIRNPRTQEVFVLVRRESYEKMRRIIDSMTSSAGWDDPALDEYEQFRNQ